MGLIAKQYFAGRVVKYFETNILAGHDQSACKTKQLDKLWVAICYVGEYKILVECTGDAGSMLNIWSS